MFQPGVESPSKAIDLPIDKDSSSINDLTMRTSFPPNEMSENNNSVSKELRELIGNHVTESSSNVGSETNANLPCKETHNKSYERQYQDSCAKKVLHVSHPVRGLCSKTMDMLTDKDAYSVNELSIRATPPQIEIQESNDNVSKELRELIGNCASDNLHEVVDGEKCRSDEEECEGCMSGVCEPVMESFFKTKDLPIDKDAFSTNELITKTATPLIEFLENKNALLPAPLPAITKIKHHSFNPHTPARARNMPHLLHSPLGTLSTKNAETAEVFKVTPSPSLSTSLFVEEIDQVRPTSKSQEWYVKKKSIEYRKKACI